MTKRVIHYGWKMTSSEGKDYAAFEQWQTRVWDPGKTKTEGT